MAFIISLAYSLVGPVSIARIVSFPTIKPVLTIFAPFSRENDSCLPQNTKTSGAIMSASSLYRVVSAFTSEECDSPKSAAVTKKDISDLQELISQWRSLLSQTPGPCYR